MGINTHTSEDKKDENFPLNSLKHVDAYGCCHFKWKEKKKKKSLNND